MGSIFMYGLNMGVPVPPAGTNAEVGFIPNGIPNGVGTPVTGVGRPCDTNGVDVTMGVPVGEVADRVCTRKPADDAGAVTCNEREVDGVPGCDGGCDDTCEGNNPGAADNTAK